jgi:acyl-CoA thioesterase-1
MRRTTTAFLAALLLAPLSALRSADAPAKAAVPAEFAAIVDEPALPRVLLIGDSISIGYTLAVRRELAGTANVHRPPANCGSTKIGLRDLDRWLGGMRWDVIHFNFGLHDLGYRWPDDTNRNAEGIYATPANGGRQNVPPADYEQNLRELVARLKRTGAKLIFATTTPVSADLNSYVKGAELPYNAAALRVMHSERVAIDDLWAFATPQIDQLQIPGNPHFTAKGSAVLAQQVARSIRAALATPVPAPTALDDTKWLQTAGTLLFHDAFEREEDGNLAKAIGNGWNSATADRVPHIKMADLDAGILKISSASKEAGHQAHIHHEAGFTDGGVMVRFRFPGLTKGESLQLGFVDREEKGIHAGHLCYAVLGPGGLMLWDWKTGVGNLEIRQRRQPYLDRKEKLPADLDALLATKQHTTPWKPDTAWHELVLVTEGDEMRLSLDGQLLARHRSAGFAHPMKRWFSFLVPNAVWIDDVKIWKVK